MRAAHVLFTGSASDGLEACEPQPLAQCGKVAREKQIKAFLGGSDLEIVEETGGVPSLLFACQLVFNHCKLMI